MKIKNLYLGLGLAMLGLFAHAQNGLESVVVERYYVSTAADAAASVGTLPAGSVTYRIYADMLPGYKFQAAYGTTTHTLRITSNTSFFNNEDRGAGSPTYTKAQAALNTVMLDSWLTVGAAAAGQFGVLKSEDNVALGGATVVHPAGVLANSGGQMGIALTVQDGLWAGAPQGITLVGPQVSAGISIFDATSQAGGDFTITDGAWSALSGAVGPTTANRVLLGQFTTNGTLHFELNIQIGTPSGGTEKYVASNPVASNGEVTIPSLTQTLFAAPQPPSVSLSSPASNLTFPIGFPVAIAANAADVDGTITQVEFFVDGVSIGIDASAPYTASYSGITEATHTLTAKATDNEGQLTTSAPITFIVGNAAPAVSITNPAAASVYVVGDVVLVSATSTDGDGTVASLQIYVDGVAIGAPATGTSASLAASASYTSVTGVHLITAKATDNNGKSTVSSPVSITVNANQLPSIAITSPSGGSAPALNSDLVITAQATDIDGTISSVVFSKTVAGVTSIIPGTVTIAGNLYSITVPAASLVQGPLKISAVATDNQGGAKTSAEITVVITDTDVAYKIVDVTQACNVGSVCLPVRAMKAVSNVIGYNFTVKYDKTKVIPTGVVTVSPALLGGVSPDQTSYDTYQDVTAGTIAVSIYFKGSAPVTAAFNGTGDVACVGFNQLAGFTGDAIAVFSFNGEPVVESYATQALDKTGSDGNLEIFKDWFLTSNLKNWSDSQPIKYDPLSPAAYLVSSILGSTPQSGAAGAAVQPDINGKFKYDVRNGLAIDIQRDIINSTLVNSVIEGNDAHLTSGVSLSNPAFAPAIYSIIAMDVNRDQRITAGDATQINRRSVNLIGEFTQVGGEHKDWLFVAQTEVNNTPAYKISATFPSNDGLGYSKNKVPYIAKLQNVIYNTDYLVCPELLTQEDYLGVMLGDADGTYASISHDGLLKHADAATAEIVIDLSKASINNGELQIPVSLNSDEAVTSYSFQLTLNDNVKVKSIVSNAVANLDWNYVAAYKALLVSTYTTSTNTIPTQTDIASIKFDGMSIALSDFSAVTSKVNGKTANVVLMNPTAISPSRVDNSVKVYPNPASDKVYIETSSDSKIKMFDFNGKQVIGERNINANSLHSVDVSALAPGVYMMKVYNDKSVTTQKVVIKK